MASMSTGFFPLICRKNRMNVASFMGLTRLIDQFNRVQFVPVNEVAPEVVFVPVPFHTLNHHVGFFRKSG